jgi:hypothetical protein
MVASVISHQRTPGQHSRANPEADPTYAPNQLCVSCDRCLKPKHVVISTATLMRLGVELDRSARCTASCYYWVRPPESRTEGVEWFPSISADGFAVSVAFFGASYPVPTAVPAVAAAVAADVVSAAAAFKLAVFGKFTAGRFA